MVRLPGGDPAKDEEVEQWERLIGCVRMQIFECMISLNMESSHEEFK